MTGTAVALSDQEASSEAFVEKAAEVVARTEQYAKIADRDRRLPDAAVEVLIDSGLVKLLRPRRLGGHEVPPAVYVEVGRTLGTGVAALAWVFQVLSIHEWYLAYANLHLQEDIWMSDGDALVVDSVAPVGAAQVVDGGFLLSGRWRFLSGIEWANWVAVGAMVHLSDGERPEHCLLFVPKSEVRVEDDWHTVAMRGSASRAVVIEERFVPDHRMMRFGRIAKSGRPDAGGAEDGALYRIPFMPMLGLALAPAALGIAERGLKEFTDWTLTRVRPMEAGARQKDAPAAQYALAESTVRWDAAHSLALTYAERLWELGLAGECADVPEQRARFFAWRAYIARSCAELVERLFLESGANALFESHPLQLVWRESHAPAQHVALQYADGLSSLGRTLVGLEGHPVQ
jgi:3-hydroxy-9,10-secoandrosta-1,3,5(10)-triene-9,17-dione monooxygenase